MLPLGILTAVVSAIRVCGSPSLRAFVGRAQEGPGSAELELLSCTSSSTCELWNEGGIARVFGRPQVLEVVLGRADDKDFFEGKQDALGHAGILLLDNESLFHSETFWLKKPASSIKDLSKKFTGILTKLRLLKPRTRSREAPRHRRKAESRILRSPNLSLNIGIKRRSLWWFYGSAVFGIITQISTWPIERVSSKIANKRVQVLLSMGR